MIDNELRDSIFENFVINDDYMAEQMGKTYEHEFRFDDNEAVVLSTWDEYGVIGMLTAVRDLLAEYSRSSDGFERYDLPYGVIQDVSVADVMVSDAIRILTATDRSSEVVEGGLKLV